MDFQTIQQRVVAAWEEFAATNNVDLNIHYALLKLTEEVGEFTQAYLVETNQCREQKRRSFNDARASTVEELADVVRTAMLIANKLDIQLEEAILNKRPPQENVSIGHAA